MVDENVPSPIPRGAGKIPGRKHHVDAKHRGHLRVEHVWRDRTDDNADRGV